MRIEVFELEREQSTWENLVKYNLAESGVQPMRVGDLLPDDLREECLGYPQTNGSVKLRKRISTLYPGGDVDQVMVTNGTAEANYVSVWNLVEPQDEVVMMLPNYMQIWGIARSLGAEVKPWSLQQVDGRWAPDLEELEGLISDRTRLIALCNPNNPTGAVLTQDEMGAICKLASRVGAWILSDEVYQGAELSGQTTPSFYGRYDRLLVNCGLSKAYGLPGLRIGWTVGPPEKIAQLWSYKDYTTIGPGILSDRLACAALEPARRQKILERTREIIRSQLPIIQDWAKQHGELFSMIPPRAGAIVYLKYDLAVNSSVLCRRVRDEKSVLIVPGDHFGMDHFVRIGYGGEPDILQKGLSLFSEVLESVT
ncbi:aminotransferase class I/II-fold pyridoxal phosphate-dependent enzyme [Acidobacteria bacterium AH-259-L09]|nr:aminotransferase class I/II-fold pyridoxal phosphate-dependent enzyme [Acidobacteria bacterium AH-259-L09]